MYDNFVWYLSIYLGLFLTGIGLPPVPEEIAIASAAAVTAAQDLNIWPAWVATVLGLLSADTVLYGVGRMLGPHVFDYRWVQKIINTKRRQRIEKQFEEHGVKILLTARLLPPLRTGVFLIAGAIRYPYSRFIVSDAICAAIGATIFFFGSQALIALLMRAGHWALYIGAGVIAVFVLLHYYKHLRNREVRGIVEPPISILEIPEVVPSAGEAKVAEEKVPEEKVPEEKVPSGPKADGEPTPSQVSHAP